MLKQRFFFLLISLGLALAVWWAVREFGYLPRFMLPSPLDVWQRFWTAFRDGSLLRHSLVTLSEVLAGLAAGASAAMLLGYSLAKSPALEKVLTPYIIASQSIPVVAIAPLLVIWFGPGWVSKVMICSLIVFFPVLINTVVGMRSAPAELRELMRSLQASRWQTFWLLEAPAGLPVFLGGLRIGATLSVIGAVVGEFVGADSGLGYLVNAARGIYDIPLVFVAVMVLILMAMALYGFVAWVESVAVKH